MGVSSRDLQNDMIKPSKNGVLEILVHSMTHKLLISDRTINVLNGGK